MIIRQGRAAVRQHCPGPQGRSLLPHPNQKRGSIQAQRLLHRQGDLVLRSQLGVHLVLQRQYLVQVGLLRVRSLAL